MRYSITLSYDGSAFKGWQVQPDAASVQATLESALSTLLGATVAVTGAGRTDTGVNAIGYVACFDAQEGLDTPQLRYKLNAILPASTAVLEVHPEREDFHARFDARRREYTYFIHRDKDPFAAAYSYYCGYPVLDFDAMNQAAALLVGTHDFASFQKTGADNKTSVCTVFEAGWHSYVPSHVQLMGPVAPQAEAPGNYWYFRIASDRFLRGMVRAVVGTLLEVGRGKRSPESISELLNACDRCAAGESVPGNALFLSSVKY